MAVRIHPLTPGRIPDLATLFDQGGDPKWCWCAWFRVRGRDWSNATTVESRRVLQTATKEQDHAPGLVAYEGDTVVGWVSLGPREDYERLAFSKALGPLDDTAVWSIVCFVVGRKSRNQGLAAALLEAAVEYAREHGATTLQAYPIDTTDGHGSPRRRPSRARSACSNGPGSRLWHAERAARTPSPAPSCAGPSGLPGRRLDDVPTSSVAARPSSSADIDTAPPGPLDFPTARKSHALV